MGNVEHGTNYYVRIYAILVASVAAVFLLGTFVFHGNFFIVIGAALVVAIFKSAYFMHLNVEKKWIWFFLITALLCLIGFYIGTARDIQLDSGLSWKRCNAINEQNRVRIAEQTEMAAEHHPHLAGLTLPPGEDCVPQRF